MPSTNHGRRRGIHGRGRAQPGRQCNAWLGPSFPQSHAYALVRRTMRWLILIGAILVCGFLANVLWHQFFLNGA